MQVSIRAPYVLFLGSAHDHYAAKTAHGIARWRPEQCVGQIRLAGCNADTGFPDMSVAEAVAAGAKTLVVGVVNPGGRIGPEWRATLLDALDAGLDLAAGMHQRLADDPDIASRAQALGRSLHDVRHPQGDIPVGSGLPRAGKRLLAVGTDCSAGKMYTTLAMEREMKARGLNADFRATGQTGILIAGSGISVDAVVADFIAGATEVLSPANTDDHWDLIEGQGSLFHPSYAGVSLGLLHGAQAHALVMCHVPTRTYVRGWKHMPQPDLAECVRINEFHARLTNPAARVIGFSMNTSEMEESEARAYCQAVQDQFGLPCVDPVRFGVGPLVDALAAHYG